MDTSRERRRLTTIWDALDAMGATVRRVDVDVLGDDEVRDLVAYESRRLRILALEEHVSPPSAWDSRTAYLERVIALLADAMRDSGK